MNNYILANLKRILAKKSFYTTTIIFIGLMLFLTYVKAGPDYTSTGYINDVQTMIGLYPLLVGLAIFIATFYDDFKAKTVQSALGLGVSKTQVIFSKIIEVVILAIILGVITAVIIMLFPILFHIDMSAESYKNITIQYIGATVQMIGYFCLCLPILFFRYSAIEGVILYVMLSSSVIYIFSTLFLGSETVINIIGDKTFLILSNSISKIKGAIISSSSIDFTSVMMLILYFVLPIGLTIILFKKKELEF